MFLEWQVQEEEKGLLLRTFLKRKHISKLLLTAVKYREGGLLEVNGQEENVRKKVDAGDIVRVTFPPEQENERLIADYTPLDIIYEDDFLLIINKPAGMASIPSQYHPDGSVANHVKGYYQQKKIASAIHIVTRLDRETSGLMLIAKNRFAHARLSEFLQRGKLKRRYQAFVFGHVQENKGSIVAPIGRKSISIMERVVTESGKYAKTNFQLLRRMADFDHLQIELETGRTHQIRVHFAHIGHPLIGDALYGGPIEKLTRQALHSYHLHLLHPLTEEYLEFEIPLPKDLTELLAEAKMV